MGQYIYLVIVSCHLVFSTCAFAQSVGEKKAASSDPQVAVRAWEESIMDLRKGAEALLKANDRLSSENSLLFTEITNIQKSIEESKQENQQLAGEPGRLNKLMEDQAGQSKSLAKDIKDFEKKVQSLTKGHKALQEKLNRWAERQKPWETQMSNLNTKKTELEVELKLQESAPSEKMEPVKAEISALQASLLESQKKEQDIKSAIDEALAQHASAFRKTRQPNDERRGLVLELSKLKNEHKNTLAEIEKLKTENLNIEKTNTSASATPVAQKSDLERQLQSTQDELEQLKQFMAGQGPAHDKEKELHGTLQTLEKESNDLENRIFDLTQAIKVLKKENAMVEALLHLEKDAETSKASPFENIEEAIAYAYAYHGMYEEAIQKYEEALKQGANKRNVYFNLGYVYTQMGNMEEAMRHYKNVLKIDPSDSEARRNIAKLREEISKIKRKEKN